MDAQQESVGDEDPAGGEVGQSSSTPEEGAARIEPELRGQDSSLPEEGAARVEAEDFGQHSSAPEEGAA